MNDSCVRFLHRANAPSDILSIKRSREYLRLLFPGLAWSSLNSTCGIRPHSGFKGYRLYAETPPSLLRMIHVPLHSPAASPLTLPPAPRYRNSLTFHFPFIILRRSCHVFRPRCLSVFSIQNLLQEIRPRLLLQNFAIISIRVLVISTIIILIRADGIPPNATT